jgi:hypothetical protein
MKFAMVKISRLRRNPSRLYESMIMEMGASRRWTGNFDNENEMIAVVFRLLAKQEPPPDLRRVLNQITNGSGYYFFDLDLTSEEAESLGYPRDESVSTTQRHPTLDTSQFQPVHTPAISD